jgi:hypothetical protein
MGDFLARVSGTDDTPWWGRVLGTLFVIGMVLFLLWREWVSSE